MKWIDTRRDRWGKIKELEQGDEERIEDSDDDSELEEEISHTKVISMNFELSYIISWKKKILEESDEDIIDELEEASELEEEISHAKEFSMNFELWWHYILKEKDSRRKW